MTTAYAGAMQAMINGRSVYSPLYGGVQWSELSLAIVDIERIEITRGPKGKDQVEIRELWESKLERVAEKDEDREEEKERESRTPERVLGVGREAFWIRGRSGVLYVLTDKNAFLRISIGSNDSDQTKIRKTKTLARNALKRM